MLKRKKSVMKTISKKIEDLKDIRRLVIVVDMLKGFVEEGKLAATNINRVVDNQIQILNEAIKNDNTGIAFVIDCHSKSSIELKRYEEHCLREAKEVEVIDRLKQFQRFSLEYFKNSTNFIFSPNMQRDLLYLERLKTVEIIGCLSEVCILNGAIGTRTFFDQYDKDIDVCVYEDAIDTFDAPFHNSDEITKLAIEHMKSNGIKIISLKKEKK